MSKKTKVTEPVTIKKKPKAIASSSDTPKKEGRIKKYWSKYKADIDEAYGVGYVKGWEDAYSIPDRFGAKTAAAHGYKKGIKSRKKADKYNSNYTRYKK